MSKVPDSVELHEIGPVARRVLLDGLDALRAHLDAITIVGAQAVYLHTHDLDIPVAAFTSDGDLGIDPALLPDEPLLEVALQAAGFVRLYEDQAGLWFRTVTIGDKEVPVELDLLMGKTLANGNRKITQIPPHDDWATKRVDGLETAVVDRAPMTITAIEEHDHRSVIVHVAGPAALFVAKAHKLHDRFVKSAIRPDRLNNKDASDIYRLMVGTRATQVGDRFETLLTNSRVGDVTALGLEYLRQQFGGRRAPGVELAVQALAGAIDEERIRAVASAYIQALPAPSVKEK